MRLRPLWIAGRFLSRLPFPDPGEATAEDIGRSVPWYPLIGLIMGLLAALTAAGTGALGPELAATLTLMVWVWSSGALHLDGLADSADAWIGGLGSRERTLEIMKDPRSGPAAVTLIGLVLIAKWSGLKVLIEADAPWLLLWLPMLARVQLLLVLRSIPYAREQGMAAAQSRQLPRRATWIAMLLASGACVLATGWTGLVLLTATLAGFALARRSMMQRLGGFTGDTAGALVELTETLLLLICAALL
ncbi:adenosylcobinamide-GDP ribazoletransferase [Thiorhodococcus minor]|uniref:Adenosylcobinamide-GDP ribazoletransferase n=1 Tax=Thiorhodococcus minor TaxID=57489 RepID=A0A6M0K032_9GAMM|nr:adenosylcobinamide-GDP ribazoletransferase [Thiorhodococcus minor]NEV63116.1 adenosylcobinamide-GDP ribazoletransferase [Thiorhodococcus minor]